MKDLGGVRDYSSNWFLNCFFDYKCIKIIFFIFFYNNPKLYKNSNLKKKIINLQNLFLNTKTNILY
jgi:hypothetical protein